MSKVTVYNFWHYDFASDKTRLSPSKRTAVELDRIGQKPVIETAEEVDEAELDEHGRYHPKEPQGAIGRGG